MSTVMEEYLPSRRIQKCFKDNVGPAQLSRGKNIIMIMLIAVMQWSIQMTTCESAIADRSPQEIRWFNMK